MTDAQVATACDASASSSGGDVQYPIPNDRTLALAGVSAVLSLVIAIIGTTLAVVGVVRTKPATDEPTPWAAFHAWSIVLGVVGVVLATMFVVQVVIRRPVPARWNPPAPVPVTQRSLIWQGSFCAVAVGCAVFSCVASLVAAREVSTPFSANPLSSVAMTCWVASNMLAMFSGQAFKYWWSRTNCN